MSTSVSKTFSHLDFPLAMNHAVGIPAARSIIDTKKATAKEAPIALVARNINSVSSKISPTRFHFNPIPKIGGTKISTRKKSMAPIYMLRVIIRLDDSLSKIFILNLGNFPFLFLFVKGEYHGF